MRVMTRRVAGLEPGGWDHDAETAVARVFDGLAPEWHLRSSPQRTEVVRDALERGLTAASTKPELCVEIGSGVGTYTRLLEVCFDSVVSVDLSLEMLQRAPSDTSRVQCDAGRLPLRSGSADVLVLINAFLFPAEVTRVLRPRGVLVWVNSSGEETPIHLSTQDVVAALGFDLTGVESRAGAGTWCVLQRS